MGGKITPIHQEMQAEEAAARDNTTCLKNDQNKNIIVTGNVKWCSQDKINNEQNAIVHKKAEYNDVINKYLHKKFVYNDV